MPNETVPDLPEITSESFEEQVCLDSVLVEFLNDFLQLQLFLEPVRYNRERGVFEVGMDQAESLSTYITALLSEVNEKSNDPEWFPTNPLVDNSYAVSCLDQAQAMQWIRRERLPFFLQSDCYFEYRLTSCLCQMASSKQKLFRQENYSSAASPQQECATFLNMRHPDSSSDRSSPHTEGSAIHSWPLKAPRGLEQIAGVHGRQVFLDFKRFLQGRPGEKVLNLWLDIERLKTLSNIESKNRHLVWMKSQYLLRSSSTALSVELLSRLELISPQDWTEDKLCLVQPCLTEVLLLYWGRRFVMSHPQIEGSVTTSLWSCWNCQPSLPGLYSWSHHPSPLPQHSACPSQTSQTPCATGNRWSEMERMEQALCVESRAGFFFTHFCQNSGKQLWANAVQFCKELQEYRQLFYQPTLDPYRVQHKAQVLYATYVCSSALKSLGVGEQCRQHILTCLTPPFEELFDQTEEHTLSLLLEPWTLLTQQDTNTFHKVAMWEQKRFVEPELYKTLQSLYTETQCRTQKFAQQCMPPPPPAKSTKEPDLWAQVPHQFRRHHLDTLLRNRLELQHFMSFLEENFASVDLLCWLDIEQLKRTPHDAAVWEEKCNNIRAQYLSRKYLFGPSSPANKQQQTELLRLAGGWKHLQCEPLSMSVLSEVQSVVSNRIERKWLPLFLSSKEFSTRQKLQAEFGDVVEDQLFLRRRKKRQVWKHVDGVLMSSSEEVLALRRALLNPITCLHFRLFLSLRGDLLENDLLFWLEVQRYKDLCHAHCDETTVQQKVSTIISCFIDSCIPPSVQIHLPPEQAHHILERRNTLGPYIFREAQIFVFTELLKHWPAFVEFRSRVCEEQVVSELEKRKSKGRETQRRAERDQQDDKTPAVLQGERKSVIEGLIEEADMYGGMENEETIEYKRVNATGKQGCWSYSKYLAGLEREEILIHTQALREERANLCSVNSVRSGARTNSRRSSWKNTAPRSGTHTPQSASSPVTGH